MLFKDLEIKDETLMAIEKLGFTQPTEIQEKSIPLLIDGDIDFVGQAQTGTGKTAAFAIPLLEKIDLNDKNIQSLIIAPTRELANQIKEEIQKLSSFQKVRTQAIFGGVPLGNQIREIKKGKPQIIVGTPGRLCDLINRGVFDFSFCRYVVLDEADEMLDMGFFEDVQFILSEVKNKKIWMFSATMPKEILALIKKHFLSPEIVKVTKKVLTSNQVEQKYCVVHRNDRVEALSRYLDFTQNVYGIVFARTKIGCKNLADELNARGFMADALHGDMSQEQRDIAMKRFKKGKVKLLVCTDVAARGIDVNDLTHVINFALPQDNESYVHRIGRTGRGGSTGVALSIIDPSEEGRVRVIEKKTNAKIERVKLPTVEEIKTVLMEKTLERFDQFKEDEVSAESFETFKEHFVGMEKEEILTGLYSYIFGQSLKRYNGAKSIDSTKKAKGSSGAGSRTKEKFERFHVNIGKKNGVETGSLIRYVSRGLNISGGALGKITILPEFSYFELPECYADEALALSKVSYKGRRVNIQKAKPKTKGYSRRRSPTRAQA